MYKHHPLGGAVIVRTIDGAVIPFDPANTDYQAYLQWIEAGNQPEPADEPEPAEE
jgi:hypothetical protein